MATLLNTLHITDLHLNHPKVSCSFLIQNLINGLLQFRNPKSLDRLVITGDVFDRPTHMDTDAGKEILYFANFIIEYCAKHDIALILLKGTGSHDGYQSDIFVKLNTSRQSPIDLLYCDRIMTWIDRDGYRWLGIPDEATPSAEQTKAEVQKLMKAEGIEKFDLAVTHSYYDFHAGAEYNPTVAFDSKFYQGIVKHIIYNGHIHGSSYRRKVLTGGSYDRNRHGEEEPKGMWNVKVDGDIVTVDFIENKNAAKFLTYPIKNTEPTEILREITDYITECNYPDIWWLRLTHPKSVDMTDIVKQLKTKHAARIDITTKKVDESDEPTWVSGGLTRKLIKNAVEITPILPSTIHDLMADKLKRMGVEDIDKHLSVFKEFT